MSQFTPEEIQAFVIPCHGNLAQVKAMAAENPALINTRYEPWNETPLGAASHVGNRPIAEFLLAQGAALEICAAAMLGRVDEVLAFIDEDPAMATATGAHDIPLMHHVALSGSVELAEAVVARGGGDGIATALNPAVAKGHLEMVRWLLDHGADPAATDPRGRTALEVARIVEAEEIVALLENASSTNS